MKGSEIAEERKAAYHDSRQLSFMLVEVTEYPNGNLVRREFHSDYWNLKYPATALNQF